MNIPFSLDDIVPRLVSEFGYTELEARTTAELLAESDPRIQELFRSWWQGGAVDDVFSIEGYTAQRLVAEQRIHPVAAYATLEWIRRDPQQALALIHGGHDAVESASELRE